LKNLLSLARVVTCCESRNVIASYVPRVNAALDVPAAIDVLARAL
jgi:hypothetical protein